MSDYISMHHKSTTIEFAQYILKHPKLMDINGANGETVIFDYGSGIGNFAEAAHKLRLLESLKFIGIELDQKLFEESTLRVNKMKDERLDIRCMDSCDLPYEFLRMIRGHHRVVIFK